MTDKVPNENQLPRLESMTFGMILDRSINLYIKNFGLLFGIMALSQVINHIIYVVYTETSKGTFSVAMIAYAPVYLLVYLLTMAVGTGAVTIAISSRYLGREITILQSYRIAFRKMWPLLGAWILAGLLVGLGFALLLVPGILFAVAYSLITPVIMLEDISVGKSLKRSWGLTAGFRWQIFALFLIYYVVYYTLAGVIGGLLTLVFGLILTTSGVQPYLDQLLLAPLLILTTPILSLFTVLIYYNQRIKKEGFDLSLLAEALTQE